MAKIEKARDRLTSNIETFAGQKRKAIDYISKHISETIMFSLRQIAKRARVSPATLVLVAQKLGYDSYSEFKRALQEEESGVLDYFAAGARVLQDPSTSSGLSSFSDRIAAADIQNIEASMVNQGESIARVAELLRNARRVYVTGMRATYGVAHYLAYLMQLVRDEVVFLDNGAAMAGDNLSTTGEMDALVCFGFYPYISQTILLAQYAANVGANIISITDSKNSPLIHKKKHTLIFETKSPWVIGSVSSATCISQAIVAHMISLGGEAILDRLDKRERLLQEFGIYKL